jgi:predicted regulator of Ras-like GTPase activity (Roadblock/LC7/MglB family)
MNKVSKDQLLLQQLQDILLRGDRAKIQRLQSIFDNKDLLAERISPIINDHLEHLRENYPEQYRIIVLDLINQRAQQLEASIASLQKLLKTKEELAEKVSPIVEDHIQSLKENYPEEFQRVVDHQIEQKIKDSQEDILNVITPVLGKLIRKSITHQFQMLKERIDKQIRSTFSRQGFFGRIFRRKTKVNEADIILSKVDAPDVQEIYVIQQDSGLLIGSASSDETMDKDVIAGMFTAIKAFVEDAFQKDEQELEMIEYDNYKIFIQNFYSYYIAVIISGSISATEREAISDKLYDFAEKELRKIPKDIDSQLTQRISKQLNQHFFIDKMESGK